LKRDNELSDYYFNLGEIFLFEKQYQKAKEHYAEGLRIDLLHDNRANLPSDYVMIGELSFEMGDLVEAERHFQLAVQAGKRIDSPADLAQAYHGLGRIYAKKNHISKAREHLRLAQELYYSLGFPEYQQIKEEYAGLSSAGRP
jgi:tetratricopeptide (TPR) repeat protein